METWLGAVVAGLLVLGLILMAAGMQGIGAARTLSYFRLRRERMVHAWTQVLLGIGLAILAGLVWLLGRPLVVSVANPSPTAPAAPRTPTPSPTIRPLFTASLTETLGLPAGSSNEDLFNLLASPAASPTPVATRDPDATPVYPAERITPPGPLTVTPLPNAVAGVIRLTTQNECTNRTLEGQTTFQPNTGPIYALFDFNNWIANAMWTEVWYFNDTIIHIQSYYWQGSTGGCAFVDYDNDGQPWRPGDYEVQVWMGNTWMERARFSIQP